MHLFPTSFSVLAPSIHKHFQNFYFKFLLLAVSVFMSILTPLLHMFQPTWPSSGALKLLEELLHCLPLL
jgi:hypothetical protein